VAQDSEEPFVMKTLRALFQQPRASNFLAGMTHALRDQLARDDKRNMKFASIPLDIFETKVPVEIRSSWIFVLRDGAEFSAERHPNSIQRMFSFDGSGVTQTWVDGAWRSHPLTSEKQEVGVSIPVMVWHRSRATSGDWSIVSFHTASADDLIEELGDPQHGRIVSHLKYSEGANQ
jgi:hypothetical protein